MDMTNNLQTETIRAVSGCYPYADQTDTLDTIGKDREYSDRWLRGYAEKYSGDYDKMIEGVAAGKCAIFGKELEYKDFRPGSEFWRHVSVVTGKTFTERHIENTSFWYAC